MGWEYLLSYPLMLSGMYFLLRRRLGRRDAAMVGSLAFTFSSFNLLHFVHPNAVAAVAHIPWLLAMIDIVLVDAKRWRVALAQAFLALLTGSQIAAGLPAIRLVFAVGRSLFRAVPGRHAEVLAPRGLRNDAHVPRLHRLPPQFDRARRHGQGASACWSAAVQLLPTLDALRQSTREAADTPKAPRCTRSI